jgi:hypothetical protein
MLQGCGGYHQIGLRESVPNSTTVFDQKAPFEHDIFGYG